MWWRNRDRPGGGPDAESDTRAATGGDRLAVCFRRNLAELAGNGIDEHRPYHGRTRGGQPGGGFAGGSCLPADCVPGGKTTNRRSRRTLTNIPS